VKLTGDLSCRTAEAAKKLRCSFISVIGPGMTLNGWNPLTSLKLYKQICLPSALYGCELWHHISGPKVKELEVAHRYCVKLAQRLPSRTRTDMCTAMLAFPNVLSYIEYRKLLFLGRLMHTDDSKSAKSVFSARLRDQLSGRQLQGFLPGIVDILNKYGLYYVLTGYVESGIAPSKAIWRNLVKQNIEDKTSTNWFSRLSEDRNFQRFLSVQNNCYLPCVIWTAAKYFKTDLHKFAFLAKLLCVPQSHGDQVCSFCNQITNDYVCHFMIN
jgi:hypothetical protein